MTTDLNQLPGTPTVLLWALLLWLITTPAIRAQCLTPELVMINSCITHPNPNGSPIPVESEILIVRTGLVEVPVNTVGVDLPFNGFGAANEDLGVRFDGTPFDCAFKEPTVTALSGCNSVIPLGPNDIIPPNAFVVIFVNGTTLTADAMMMDFTNVCAGDEPVFILQSACERTASAFANQPGAGDPIRFINVSSPCGSRGFTYNTEELDPDPGTYFLVGPAESGNLDCAFPVIPETCPPLDTVYTICNAGAVVDPPLPTDAFRAVYPASVLTVSFHPTAMLAELNLSRIDFYSNSTTAADTLYARVVYGDNLCIAVSQLIVRFMDGVAVTTRPAGPARGCDPDFDGTGRFDLRLLDAEIGGGQPVVYYLDAAATMPIDDPTRYDSPAGTIFAAAGLGDCRGDVVPLTLELIDGPFVVVEVAPTTCSGNQDGSVEFEVAGFGPYDFNWASNQYDGQSVVDDIPAGRYRVTITDAWGCANVQRVRVADGTATQLACAIGRPASGALTADGVINLTISEGNGPFQLTYTYGGAAAGAREITGSTAELTGLLAGQYVFSLTDADGCTAESCTLDLPFTNPLVLDCALRSNTNGGSVRGAITTTILGGLAPFRLTVTPLSGGAPLTLDNLPAGERVIDNLAAGDYRILLTDANGNSAVCEQTISTVPCPLDVVAVNIRIDNCAAADNFIIQLTIAGAEGSVSTAWRGAPGVDQFNGQQEAGPLAPGTYFVDVTDGSSCPPITAGPIVITSPATTRFTATSTLENNGCLADGRIDVTVSEGTGPFTVQLLAADQTTVLDATEGVIPGDLTSFPGLTAGPGTVEYAVVVINGLGCPSTAMPLLLSGGGAVSITLPPNLQTTRSPSCAGGSTGLIELMAQGGTGPYVYTWTDSPDLPDGRVLQPGNRQQDLPAGTYTIDLTDANGCTGTGMVTLNEGETPAITCAGALPETNNVPGAARFIIVGSNGPFVINLTREGTTTSFADRTAGDNTVTPLTAGDYLASVTDANGCRSEACPFTITGDRCLLTATPVVEPITCVRPARGLARFVPTSGAGPYRFAWAADASNTADSLLVAAPGDYAVTITDVNGCILETSVTVPEIDDAPAVTFGSPLFLPYCVGQEALIPVEFTGRSPYRLNLSFAVPPEPIVEITYRLNQTDTVRIRPRSPDPDGRVPVLITSASNGNTGCRRQINEQYYLIPTPPDTLTVTDTICGTTPQTIAGRTFTPTDPAGDFDVADATGCLTRYQVDLTFLTDGEPLVRRTDTFCLQEPVLIGGRTFTPANPSDTFTVATDGQCDTRYEVDLTYLAGGVVDTVRNFGSVCQDTPVEVGGRVFTAAFPSDTFLVDLPAGCRRRYEVALDFGTPAVPDTVVMPACPGVPIIINGAEFDANRPEGPVAFTRPGRCDSVVYVRLDIAPQFFGTYGENRCAGDTVRFGDRVFTVDDPSGLARLPGLAASGCDSLVVVTNNFQRTGEVRLFGDFEICPGDSVDLRFTYDGPGGIDVLLADGQGNTRELSNIRQGTRVRVFPTVSTTYRLLSASTSRCAGTVAGSSSVVINDLNGSAAVLTDPGDFCLDTLGLAEVNLSGGVAPYDIVWSNGPTDLLNRNLLPGTYRVSVTDADGCTFQDSVSLTPRIPLDVALSGLAPVCPGESGRVVVDSIAGGAGFYEVSLDGTFFVPLANVDQLVPVIGNNRAFVQDAGDCTARVNFFVPPAAEISTNLFRDTTIRQGDSLLLDPGSITGLDTAFWTPARGLRTPGSLTTVAQPLLSTDYVLHLRTAAQCEFTFRLSITVDGRTPVYAPTAFSPNGDGMNDVFALGLGAGVEAVERVQIFDRWGVLVHDGVSGWDGNYRGQKAPAAVYVFQARVRLTGGETRTVKGELVLVR